MTGRMLGDLLGRFRDDRLRIWALVGVVLLGSVLAGYVGSPLVLLVPIAGLGGVILLQWPILGLAGLLFAALLVPFEFSTGTEVSLNPAVLLVPALLALWMLVMIRQRELRPAPSRTNRPLALFLASGLLSLLIGNALWDPAVPHPDSFLIVQLAQWAIFAFSAGAFWLAGNLIDDETWLRRLTFLFLSIGGGLASAIVVSGGANLVELGVATIAVVRAPFVLLVAALSAGQLLFNRQLSIAWRLCLIAVLAAVAVYTFHFMSKTVSFWAGVVAAAGVLAWLRWPRLRWLAVFLLVALAASGFLSSTVYEFAGGEAEWAESGGSRLALIGRVVEVTMRNPLTGLGPAAYREYARIEPLKSYAALWLSPRISSHNNWVDLFSHVGLLGLGLFLWFAAEVTRLGLRLRDHYTAGFAAGYVNAMLAVGAGALTLMLFADWILPFIYNIGFPGFQASVLVWLFLGGLVALEQIAKREPAA